MPPRLRSFMSFSLKVGISALLLYLSAKWVNFGTIKGRIDNISLGWIAIVFATLLLQAVPISWRWQQIIAANRTFVPYSELARFFLIGQFFSQTLPATIGGDAFRIWLLARHGAGWSTATYSVVIDRTIGLFALAFLVLGCLPWTFELIRDPYARTGITLLGLAGVGGPLAFLMIGFLHWSWLDRLWATRHLSAASKLTIRVLSGRNCFTIFCASFLVHGLTVLAGYAAAKAIGAPIGLEIVLLLLPPVVLISTIPVSIAGWGVRESSMVAAFAFSGLPQSDGLLMSLILGLMTFAVGAIGGIIWIGRGETGVRAVEK